MSKYVMIDKAVLPNVFIKVIMAKEALNNGEAKDIPEACDIVGISKSTFYKYKDSVFPVNGDE